MYIVDEDLDILWSAEVMEMQEKYRKKFGEIFICFNYVDFPGNQTQRPAEMYREVLKKALLDNKSCQMVSHRYDRIDH